MGIEMNIILMVYVKNAFKEFILPSMDNANYSFVLHKEVFDLEKDEEIVLEVVEQQWKFLVQKEYSIKKQDVVYFGETLQDGDVLELITKQNQRASIIVIQTTKSFQVFKKYDISSISEITIGKEALNTIQYDFYGLISRRHARLYRSSNGFVIEDVSSNGIFLNSRRITSGKKLEFGDCINAFGLHLVYLGNVLGICGIGEGLQVNEGILRPYIKQNVTVMPGSVTNKRGEKEFFHRSPRDIPQLYKTPIEIETPPEPKRSKPQPMFMTIGPAFTMAIPMMLGSLLAITGTRGGNGLYMMSGLITALASAILGVVWALLNIKYTKKAETEEEEHRFGAYSNYLIKRADFIREKYDQNGKIMNEIYPSAEVCCSYNENTSILWNRNFNHEDFLFVRLGIGSVPFQAAINIPSKKFTLVEDFLAEKPEVIFESYHTLHNVPVGVDLLKYRLLGLIGGVKKKGAIEVVHSIIAQIAANNSYTDVKMIVAYDEKNEEDKKNWAFVKWLPHLWSEDKKTRFFATNSEEASDVFYELANIIRIRAENTGESKKKEVKPHYILFLANPELLEGELLAKYAFESKPEYGLTTFLLAEKYEDLPNTCEDIIHNDENSKGIYNVLEGTMNKKAVEFDKVPISQLEVFTRRLAQIEVNELESSGDMPNSLDFFEMYGVSRLEEFNVLDRWRKNRTYDSMKALIGKKAGGNDCYLDIHEKYHGPHGLIAGTTGSGKSETLQTYMLSLAIDFSPYDIGFFVIDFKGGGMANLFSDLPHMIGQISNLSGNQVHRAMVSIKSENMRRQRIFNEHGVNNINLYTRLLKNNEASIPIPHLFIIIDEFAELKREEPDFMRELISVAQVGRSLGVHLILATQKPSGTVDDNIWSNTKFRLCLRVQDRQDSNDMLHKPDAAYITQAGRCYLQVGNDEIYELFQSGWSGATYDESMINQSAIATMLTVNGKAAIIGSRTKIKQKEETKMRWLLALTACINDAAQKLNISIAEAQKVPVVLTRLIDETYICLEKAELDYPDSKYNRIRLEDFIQLWEVESTSAEANVQTIIKKSAVEGKKLPELKEKTQLDAVVEYLGDIAKKNQYTHNLQLWMPVLPTKLYLKELFGYEETIFNGGEWKEETENWTLEAIIGLCDDPVNQSQMPLVVDFAENGHHAICGTVVSGKSTFLQSLIYSLINRYTPEHVNIYGLDFSSQMLGAFEGAAHVGGIMYEGDLDRIGKFFNMIGRILEERKQLFKGGNYKQYVQVNGIVVPSIIIAIDNMANFREKTEDIYEDILLTLSRDGAGYGIFLVMSSAGFGMTEIPSKVGDNIRTVICLEMGDKFKYADALRIMHFDVLPEADVRGRGLALVNGSVLEFQTALSIEAEDDYQRSERIVARCEEMNEAWTGRWAKVVPEIPEQPVLSEFSQLEDYNTMVQGNRSVPIGYNMEDASVYGVDLSDTYCYLVTGKSRTGRSNFLKIFIHGVSKMDADFCIFDVAGGKLKRTANELDCQYITTDEEMFEYWKDLIPIFAQRNKVKRQFIEDGLDDIEIYEKMREEKPIFIFVADAKAFMKSIYTPTEGVGEMNGFMENISEKGRLHNIFFILAMETEEMLELSAYEAFNNFTSYKRGIHFGGNIVSHRIFSFDNIPYMEQSKVMKPGIGLTPSQEDENQASTVVIPLARG